MYTSLHDRICINNYSVQLTYGVLVVCYDPTYLGNKAVSYMLLENHELILHELLLYVINNVYP